MYAEKLDDEGLTPVRRQRAGEFFRPEHRFAAVSEGTRYRSRMIVGPASGMNRGLFNNLVRPRMFADAMGTAWLAHNVEEVSLLKHILPSLDAGRSSKGG